jgi:anthranilate phosphoribosyltransferase
VTFKIKIMKEILNQLFEYKTLSRDEAREVLTRIAGGEVNETQMAVFLSIFLMRSITIEELSGFRDAMKDLAVTIDLGHVRTIDLCGTGGDGKNTFNISTLTSFVVAGAGEKVAKHGNYGVSSSCGSSNVLEYFGYRFSNDPLKLRSEMDRAGICFLHAPLFNPAMKNIAPVRKQLGLKTFFNILGPMINPSSPSHQLTGVFSLELLRLYQYQYQNLDLQYAIVHSLDGYDEVSLTGPFKMVTRQGEAILYPDDLNLRLLHPGEIAGGSTVAENADIFRRVLEGKGSEAQREVVLANAMVALQVIHPDLSFNSCLEKASESLDSGKALQCFETLIQMNQS